jgi:hypothetical protein
VWIARGRERIGLGGYLHPDTYSRKASDQYSSERGELVPS